MTASAARRSDDFGNETPADAMNGRAVQQEPDRIEPATDATRYLCAGLYRDAAYLARVRATLIDDRHHSIATSPAIDSATIVRHCVAAGQRLTRRQLNHFLILLGVVVAEIMWISARQDVYVLDFDPPLILGAVVAFLVSFADQWAISFGRIASQLRRETFESDPLNGRYGAEASERLEELAELSDSNVVVYSGFSPFVGSGIDLGGWSFTVDVERGKEELDGSRARVEPFEISDLYAEVQSKLLGLGIPELVVGDYVFVNGRDVRGDERFLPSPFQRPHSEISSLELQACVDGPDARVRHYKCARIVDWNGDLVLSIFFRVAQKGASLFAEACFLLLTPVKDNYRTIDNQPVNPSIRQAIGTFVGAIFLTPFQVLGSPFAIWAKVQESFERGKHEREQRKQIEEQPLFDFGAAASIRELAASGEYRRYFQKLDKEMYAKVTQRTLLDALCQFLDAHRIDTSDVRDRQATIYNSGVMVSGGTINADTLTVGKRAKSIRHAIREAGSSSPTHAPGN